MRISWLLILVLFFSCSSEPEHKKHTGLFAHLSSVKTTVHSLDDAVVKACIRNYGSSDTTINEFVFQNAVLATEVKDDSGNALLSLPPPVPPIGLNEYKRVLQPGDSVLYNYKLNIFVSPERKGKYYIRLRRIESEELEIIVQ